MNSEAVLREENAQLRALPAAAPLDVERMEWLEAHPRSAGVMGGADDGHAGIFRGVAAHGGTLRDAVDAIRRAG